MNYLLTGATGFVGRVLLKSLLSRGDTVKVLVRKHDSSLPESVRQFEIGDLRHISAGSEEVLDFCADVDIFVHLAALAHIAVSSSDQMQEAFRQVNVEPSAQLGEIASRVKAKRFIYISSIGVNGEGIGEAYRWDDQPNPMNAYAMSKRNAEIELQKISNEADLQLVIIRPPLVYGPSAPGNFSRLVGLVNSGLPLPFQSIVNKRSFISVWNLVDLIIRASENSNAVGKVFLASDDHNLSTSAFMQCIAKQKEISLKLFPVPAGLIRLMFSVVGKRKLYNKVFGNLFVDISHTKKTLDWTPPLSIEESLRLCFSDEGKLKDDTRA